MFPNTYSGYSELDYFVGYFQVLKTSATFMEFGSYNLNIQNGILFKF